MSFAVKSSSKTAQQSDVLGSLLGGRETPAGSDQRWAVTRPGSTTSGSGEFGWDGAAHMHDRVEEASAVEEFAEDWEPEDGALSWQERALCAQTDPEAFFPEKGGSTREAKKVCLSCDVRSECLEYALAKDERFGIWGGLSERERRKLKKRAV